MVIVVIAEVLIRKRERVPEQKDQKLQLPANRKKAQNRAYDYER